MMLERFTFRPASARMRFVHRQGRMYLACVCALVSLTGASADDVIKAKVAEAAKASQSSNQAQAEGKADEAKTLAETSARLLDEARSEYDAIGAAASDDPPLLTDYADLLSVMGDFDLAEKALLRAVEIDPEDPAVWLKLGQAEGQLGPQAESRAIRSLRRAAEIEPKTDVTVQANATLGLMYEQAGLYDFAREAFGKALEQDANHTGAKLALAALDAREGQMVKAKAAYDAVESATVQYGPFIERTLGAALNDFDESRRFLEDTPEMQFAYAQLLVRAGRLQDSYWPLSRALKLDDKNYIAWNLMGSILRSVNKLESARGAFEKSLALNPDQPRTQQAIAEIDAASGTPDGQPAPTNAAAPESTSPVGAEADSACQPLSGSAPAVPVSP